MGKIKSFIICVMAAACPVLIATDNAVGEALRSAAYLSAGIYTAESSSSGNIPGDNSKPDNSVNSNPQSSSSSGFTETISQSGTENSSNSSDNRFSAEQ